MCRGTCIKSRFTGGGDMKFRIAWEPRWPCAAIGFYRGKRTDKYSKFSVILWALVFEIGVKE